MNFYDENADNFFNQTVNANMQPLYNRFLKYLPTKNGKILDLGCGSGRDSKYFKSLGFEVTPIDSSSQLSKIASEYLGQKVIIKDMRKLDYTCEFDGVWACASILHIPLVDIGSVFDKIFKSLKNDGVFYASFKYGEIDYSKDNREFTCFTSEKFLKYFPQYRDKILEIFITNDCRKGRKNEKWFNIIMKK